MNSKLLRLFSDNYELVEVLRAYAKTQYPLGKNPYEIALLGRRGVRRRLSFRPDLENATWGRINEIAPLPRITPFGLRISRFA